MKLLVFHSPEGDEAMHQLNGMITVQLFPFGNTDTWRMKPGFGKAHSLCTSLCQDMLICALCDGVCFLAFGIFKKKSHADFKILSAF